VFHPQLTFVSPSYSAAVEEQVWSLYTDAVSGLEDNYKLISRVIDLEKSPAWQDGSVTELKTDDTELSLELNAEPNLSGSLKTACSISDALVLQYYEEADEQKAAFGHNLTREEWTAISEIKDVYGDVLFTAPLVAANVAHPLLQEIQTELETPGRDFTFLCGHDSNVGSVLAALGVEDYELPDAIEQTTPIGCKLVFTRWKAADGGTYYGLDLVYQTCEQLRTQPLLGLENPPAMVPLFLSGLSANEDGVYSEGDFLGRLSQAITEYDRIVKTYSDPTADAA
jgi:glucose-1-phosphatase